jgi:hypothetical protein
MGMQKMEAKKEVKEGGAKILVHGPFLLKPYFGGLCHGQSHAR